MEALNGMDSAPVFPLETLIANAIRTGRSAHHVALACGFLPGLGNVASLCAWCAERTPGTAWRLGGDCQECAYSGPDCLVVDAA